MARQHAEIPFGTGDLHFVDPLVDERPIGGHDVQLQVESFDGATVSVPSHFGFAAYSACRVSASAR